MSSMNYVILMGGLTRDPELRRTSGGLAIAKFSLAVSEKYTDKTGKVTDSVCYIDIDAWAKLWENCAHYLKKGSQALVQGKLQMEQWTGKDGTKRSKLSLRATEVQFLNRPPARDEEIEDAADVPSPIRPPIRTKIDETLPNDVDNDEPPF